MKVILGNAHIAPHVHSTLVFEGHLLGFHVSFWGLGFRVLGFGS